MGDRAEWYRASEQKLTGEISPDIFKECFFPGLTVSPGNRLSERDQKKRLI